MSTSDFVLVIGVVVSVAAAVSALAMWVRCSSLVTRVEHSSVGKLRAELDSLADVVDAHKRATRSEFGKVWQKFAPPKDVNGDESRDPNTTDWAAGGRVNGAAEPTVDDELAAMLALQSADSAGPGSPR